ncbi:MAG TPA: hypothetical protein VK789_29745 [Bryobacteraceae bacterium]|jgi:hypothetical protein|nr:hypothetical protein [Bryobacteraceae bacterium]
MDDFADVAKARAAYKVFAEALSAGRGIIQRAGVAAPPPIPDFDIVFRKLNSEMRRELYAALGQAEAISPADAIRIWQPLIRRAFGQPRV